jgi:hypothetical protein
VKKKSTKVSKPVDLVILLQDTHQGKSKLAAVNRELKALGFEIKEHLEGIGVLTGSAPQSAIAALESVPGVSKVDREATDYETSREL